jgi:hypothetical protein
MLEPSKNPLTNNLEKAQESILASIEILGSSTDLTVLRALANLNTANDSLTKALRSLTKSSGPDNDASQQFLDKLKQPISELQLERRALNALSRVTV